jgi:hypothetical protein
MAKEHVMAKEKKRGNRETKKPKKNKEPAAAPISLIKGVTSSSELLKKKG